MTDRELARLRGDAARSRAQSQRDKSRKELDIPRPRTTHWTEQAACAGKNVETFFNDWGDRDAKEICGKCPVTAECLAAYLFEPYGTFGGLTPRERDNYRRNVRRSNKKRFGKNNQYTHGSRSGYQSGKCRCDDCRKANTAYDQERRRSR